MYLFTSLKRLWLWLILTFSIIGTSFANYTTFPNPPINLEEDTWRYKISLWESVEQITICGLSPGEAYDFTINASEMGSECNFLLSPMEAGQIGNQEIDETMANKQLQLTPKESCRTISIINDNCITSERYEVYLTVLDQSCKETLEGGYLPEMQVIYVSDALYSTEELITNVFIAGGCFDILNVAGIGNGQGRGFFGEAEIAMGMESGVILSSGDIDNAPGPNDSGGTSTNFGDNSGDPDLDLIGAGAGINDAVGIEFDFVPSLDQITFNYIFASEEYCEYVNSSFNDVFGFFISGPGINGTFTNNAENIALVPGSGQYVGINTVNHLLNQQYFRGNDPNTGGSCGNDPPPAAPAFVQYDGFTTTLQAVANVIPCETYHIRLVVADAGDNVFDSAVFLEANSFTAGGEAYAESNIPGTLGDDTIYEGCGGAELVFNRWGNDWSQDLWVPFILGSGTTAIEGVDFSSLPDSILIPAGSGSVSFPLTVFEDFIIEGQETIIIELTSSCACFNPILEIFINDMVPLEVIMEDAQVCGSGDVTLSPTVSGGVTDYTYAWSNNSSDPTLTVFANSSTSFDVTITDVCGNTATETAEIIVTPTPSATLSGTVQACAEAPDGQLQIDFLGEGPWEFSYTHNGTSFGPIVTSDNPYTLNINQEGTFTLTDVNVGICPGSASGSVEVDWMEVNVVANATDVLCYESYDGTATALADGALDPYTYVWNNGTYYGSNISGLGEGTYTVTATDAIGCTQQISVSITQPTALTASAVATQQVDCNNPFGAAQLTNGGGTPGYTISWDNGSSQQNPQDLNAGPNTVLITDDNGCTIETTVDIAEDLNFPIPDVYVSDQLSCNVTSVTLDASNSFGNGPLAYEWYNDAGDLIATTATYDVSLAGFYFLILTDLNNGCQDFADVTVDEDQDVPSSVITASGLIDCINTDVTLDGSNSTASGGVNYQWQNSGGGNLGNGSTVTVNAAGTYTLIITDATNGCTNTSTFDVATNNTIPEAIIASTDTIGCVGGTATLDGSDSNGQGTISYQWFDSNNQAIGSNPSVDVLNAGGYTLVITDSENGCTASSAYTVPENTTPPPASATVSGPLTCADVMATLDGDDGNGTYNVQWFDDTGNPIGAGSNQVDVSTPGNYTLTVTNPTTGCTADAIVTVTEDVTLPLAEAGPTGTITCDSGAATLSGSGSSTGTDYTYAWYNENNVLVSTSLDTDVTEAGGYTLVVTNTANGCTSSDVTSVVPDVNLPTVSIDPPETLNCNFDNVDIVGSGSGSGTLSYAWTNASGGNAGSTPTINVNAPGVYTLTVTNTDNGCSSEASIEVLENMNLPEAEATTADMITCVNTSALLDGTGSTVDGTIQYEWFDGGTSIGSDPTVTVTVAGQYTLIITDTDNGCTMSTTVTVPENNEFPQPDAVASGLITCDDEMVSLDASGSSSGGTITFEWFDGNQSLGTDEAIDVDATGTYTLVVIDSESGCTNSTTVAVADDLDEPNAVADVNSLLDCVNASVTIDGSSSSGNGSITYEWFNSNNSSIGTDPTVDVNAVGTYTLVITNTSNGCTSETTASVDANSDFPVVDAAALNQLTCEITSAALEGNVSSGGTFTYSWLDANDTEIGTTLNIDVSATGTYTFIANNTDNGCSSEVTVEVTEDILAPNVEAGDDGLLTCDVSDVTLTGSGSSGVDYEWFNPSGVSIGNTEDITVSEVGTYILIVTNPNNGCTAEDFVEVAPDTNLPTAVAGNGGELNCIENTFTLDGSGSSANGTIEYEWTNAGGTVLDDTPTTEVTVPGVYTLIITDADNGCTATISVEVTQDLEEPTPSADVSGLLDCVNASVTLSGNGSTGNGAITYEWLNPSGGPIGTDPTVDVGAVGTYTLVVTNTGNGCTAETQVVVEADSDFPIVDAVALNEITCDLNAASLEGNTSGAGTFTYSWLDPADTEISTDQNIQVTTIGTYTFIATNQDNGCSSEVTVEVTDDLTTPQSEAGAEAFLTCDVTTVTLNGSGSGGANLSYEWLNPADVSIGTNPTIDVTESGTYTLIVTNTDNGCTAEDQTVVTPDANLPVALAGNGGELTCLNNTFTLDGSNSTANGTIMYEWQNDQNATVSTTAFFTANLPGVYTLLITDADNGCTSTATVQVTENTTDPVPDAVTSNTIDCNNTSTILDGNGSSAGGTISYQWLDPVNAPIGNNATVAVSDAGIYTLQITDDANGCTSQTTIEVMANTADPSVSAIADDILTCTTDIVGLQSTASGTGTTLSYSWQFPAGTEISIEASITTDLPGTYLLIVTDEDNGCTNQTTVEVTQDINDPVAATGTDQTLTCDVNSVTLTGTGSSTGTNFTYEWTNPADVVVSNSIDASVSSSGVYTLLVTNTDNGCTATATSSVTPDSNLPTAFASVSDVLTCDNNSATLDGSGSSNGPGIGYEWLDSSGSPLTTDLVYNVDNPGTYTLIVTDNGNGCTSSYPIEVLQDIDTPTADAGTADLLTCDVTSVTLDGSNSTANNGTLNYEWFDPSSISISNSVTVNISDPGIYELIVTAENGCTNASTIEVEIDAAVPVADAGSDGTLDCNINTITIGGPATSTGTNITYEWLDQNNSPVGNTATIDVSQQGTYTLVVTNTDSNCATEQSVEIVENMVNPQADPGNGGLLTCVNTEVTLGGPNTSTGMNITYSWTDISGAVISTDAEIAVTDPGTYDLLVTDTENGCTASTSLTIAQDIADPTADAGDDGVLTCDVNSVILDGSLSSSGANISYQWFNSTNTPVGNQVNLTVTGAGNYTLVVTNTDNGCTAEASASVTPDAALPTAVAGMGGTLTCEIGGVTLNGAASNTVSGQIEYEWLNDLNQSISTTVDLNVTQPGVYTLVITDPDNGCSTSDAVEVMQDIAEPDVFAGNDQTLDCGTTMLDLNGSATNGTNFSYEWFDPNGISISNTSSASATVAGTYTLEVINTDNGCMSSATLNVVPDVNVPTAFAGTDDVLTCVINSVTLDANGSSSGTDITYQWTNSQGSVIANSQTVSVSGVDIYTLLVTDSSNGCTSTDQVAVTDDMEDPIPEISPVGPTSITCSTISIVLDGSQSTPIGNLSFDWTTVNGVINSGAGTSTIEAGSAGTYTLVVTNLTNGCESTTTYTVGEDMALPVAFIGSPELLTCDVIDVSLNGFGSSTGTNFSYGWQGPNGGIVSGGTTLEPVVILPGDYILTVFNEDNGCQNTANITVAQNIVEPNAVANVEDLLDCITESVIISGDGSATGTNITYVWDGPGILSGSNSLTPTVNAAGIYTLTVEDETNGCDNTASIEVEEDESVLSAVNLLTTEPICFGDPGSIAVLNAIGGQPPYQYSLDDVTYDNNGFYTQLEPGVYTLYVEDAIGCHFEQIIEIPGVPQINVQILPEISIHLGEDTQFNATTNIPTNRIQSIVWSPTDSLSCTDCLNPVVTAQTSILYTITITNVDGCVTSAEIQLNVAKDREVYIPTAFSPNADGNNDYFTVYANNQNISRISEFHVYNRWGEIVFENSNFLPNVETDGWNGQFRGEPMDAAVFVYWLEIEFVDGFKAFYSGDVTLIK